MFATALFWGSVWGLAEATPGHLLRLARVPDLPGLVMVPVAASFKLLDLFVPGLDVLALSRPLQAILLEALAGAMWVKLLLKRLPSPGGLDPGEDGPSWAGAMNHRKRPRFPTTGRP